MFEKRLHLRAEAVLTMHAEFVCRVVASRPLVHVTKTDDGLLYCSATGGGDVGEVGINSDDALPGGRLF